MKKLVQLALLIPLFVGCAGHTETATESTASGINARDNALLSWITEMQKDPEVLSDLSNLSQAGGIGEQMAESLCDDKAVTAALKERNYQPVVVQGGRNDADRGIEILRGIAKTGSTFVPPHLGEIEKLAKEYGDSGGGAQFRWLPEDAPVLEKNLRVRGFEPTGDGQKDKNVLTALLKGDSCRDILPRYCDFISKSRADASGQLDAAGRLDVLLTCDLTKWAAELRLNYPQNDYKFDRFRKYVSDDEIVSVRKHVFIEDMARRGVQKAFDYIEPADPQYQALIKARQIYADAVAAGGWPKVDAPSKIDEAGVGKKYAYVPSLRKRLQAEGYSISDVDSDVMDQALVDTIILYRDVHQLSTKKVVDSVLFKNLAVGPEVRLETIDLTLQRYREQAIGSLGYYVKVNVPDFYVEVWKDGQRQARHRIVVGNDKVQLDPVTKRQVPDPETLYPLHPNRTPIQTSKINEIIYQPYWNVPARIRIEELEPKLAQNPNYYVENNYEEVNVGDPKLYYVRELPNPKNSLGKVKFMFPNPHNTYLHDTPAKAVFKNPVRAMSHGCMRVQNPLDLAELLLKNDGQWDAQKVHGILNADPAEQVTIELKHPVDVDVVYFNARVDDSGVVAFLSDVYQYDAIRLGKVVLKKLPRPKG